MPTPTETPPDLAILEAMVGQQYQLAQQYQDEYDNIYVDRRDPSLLTAAERARAGAIGAERDLANARDRRKRDLAAIHAAAKKAGIDDDTRRAMIERLSEGRTRTAAALTAAERAALLREIGAGRARPRRGPSAADMDRQTMLKRVQQLLAEQSLPWSYAEAILRRQRGILDKSVACPIAAVTDPELRGVIAALYRRAQRERAKRNARNDGATR